MKLTEAQKNVLHELKSGPEAYANFYPPIKKLLALGYIRLIEGRYVDSYEITDAGRKALEDSRND